MFGRRASMVETALLKCIGTTIGEQGTATLDHRLVDLEFDSYRFIQLVVQLESALGVEFADDKLNYRQFERVRDVSRYLKKLVSEAA